MRRDVMTHVMMSDSSGATVVRQTRITDILLHKDCRHAGKSLNKTGTAQHSSNSHCTEYFLIVLSKSSKPYYNKSDRQQLLFVYFTYSTVHSSN